MSPAGGTVAVAIDGVRYALALGGRTEVRLGHGPECDVHLPPAVALPSITVRLAGQVLTLAVGEREASGPGGVWVSVDAAGTRVEACHTPDGARVVYDLRGRDQLVIGPRAGDCLTAAQPGMSFTARRTGRGGWAVSITGDDVFVNNVRHAPGRVVLREGDHLGSGPHDLVLFDDELHADAGAVRASRLPARATAARTPPVGYPEVRRSPRLVHRAPEGTVAVNGVPAHDDKRSGQLAKLIVPPVLMLAVTAGMAFLQGNPLFVLASGATSLVTVVFSVAGYRRDRRTQERERAAQEGAFREHLRDSAVEIHAAAERQRQGPSTTTPTSRRSTG